MRIFLLFIAFNLPTHPNARARAHALARHSHVVVVWETKIEPTKWACSQPIRTTEMGRKQRKTHRTEWILWIIFFVCGVFVFEWNDFSAFVWIHYYLFIYFLAINVSCSLLNVQNHIVEMEWCMGFFGHSLSTAFVGALSAAGIKSIHSSQCSALAMPPLRSNASRNKISKIKSVKKSISTSFWPWRRSIFFWRNQRNRRCVLCRCRTR